MDLTWPLIMLVVPTLAGLLVAWFFWGGRDATAGSVAATCVILVALLMVFALEYTEVARYYQKCGIGVRCSLSPPEFTRYSIYAAIAFLDIILVFVIGLWVEQRNRRTG